FHGDGLRVVDGGGWAGPGAQYRPAIRALPFAVKRFPKAGSATGRGTRKDKPSPSELSSWAAPADNPIKLLTGACKNCFDSCSSLTARERTTAPTIVERIVMALPLDSSPSAPPTQLPSNSIATLSSSDKTEVAFHSHGPPGFH